MLKEVLGWFSPGYSYRAKRCTDGWEVEVWDEDGGTGEGDGETMAEALICAIESYTGEEFVCRGDPRDGW